MKSYPLLQPTDKGIAEELRVGLRLFSSTACCGMKSRSPLYPFPYFYEKAPHTVQQYRAAWMGTDVPAAQRCVLLLLNLACVSFPADGKRRLCQWY